MTLTVSQSSAAAKVCYVLNGKSYCYTNHTLIIPEPYRKHNWKKLNYMLTYVKNVIHVYIYIYICIERERDRERERD